jgi:hypothetical protein
MGTLAVTQVEAMVESDGVTDDVRWKSVALVCIHGPDSSNLGSLTFQYPFLRPIHGNDEVHHVDNLRFWTTLK